MLQASSRAARLLLLGAIVAGSAIDARRDRHRMLNVTATVLSSCALNGGTLSFGDYTSGQPTDLDVDGIINYVNCSGTLTFALDGGGSGNINARQMRRVRTGSTIRSTATPAAPPVGHRRRRARQDPDREPDRPITVYGRIPKTRWWRTASTPTSSTSRCPSKRPMVRSLLVGFLLDRGSLVFGNRRIAQRGAHARGAGPRRSAAVVTCSNNAAEPVMVQVQTFAWPRAWPPMIWSRRASCWPCRRWPSFPATPSKSFAWRCGPR